MTSLAERELAEEQTGGPREISRAWWALGALAVVLVVLAGLTVRAALRERDALEDARRQHARTLGELARTRAELRSERSALRAEESLAQERAVERESARAVSEVLKAELASADGARTGAQSERAVQATRLVNVRVCLDGIRQALDATAGRDTTRAAATLRRVAPACLAAASTGAPGPVFGLDFADPFLLRAGDDVYGFATNSGGGAVQVIRSRDLAGWELVGNALANLPPWATPNSTWAPAVLPRPGGYVLYYTVREAATGRQCISAALGAAPGGPYLDPSTGPLECSAQGSIDPSPFVDGNGTAFLLWKSERPARLWSAPLTPDGRGLAGPASLLLAPGPRWQNGNVEAPSMLANRSGYWLLYSGNDWNGRAYAEGLARCRTPLGPCEHVGNSPLLASRDAVAGPGGGEVFLDRAGNWWLAYHAFREPAVGYPNSRYLHLVRLNFDASGAPVAR